ncbi:glycosyltransferase [Pseudomonas sp. CFBP 13711]|uniref:glycosyltransferase n=1 Tax=unclassified Pseudomonas TaxID=196821 RepID=UPI00177F1966|nr:MULTISPECIES: glycosyltransferase [unclassified Pseudomonas]MBD8707134.1 glycosyltransferase [Pseudomonas sp. CFBP 13711]MBD8712712.1 glycosyltransferase [Pseudomonas sp. CFBP 13715]
MSASRLVSIVIPAYKPTYFELALRSAFAQDYDQLEIVICDDCRDGGIRALVDQLTPDSPFPVRYFYNEDSLGEALNGARGVREARGEYIKFLYDDDLLEPECVSALVDVLHGYPDITLAAATRRLINEKGDVLRDNVLTFFPFQEDVVIHGPELVALLSELPLTFMGEPSSVMCRRDSVLAYGQDIMSLKGLPIHWLGDMSLYVKLLREGNLALLGRPLSRFRMTDTQSSSIARATPQIAKEGHANYYRITKELGWLRELADNGDVKVAPLRDRENFAPFNLRAWFLQKSSSEIRQDQILEWAWQRRPAGPQKPHIVQYFQQHNGAPTFAVIICDLHNRQQALIKTLVSVEAATRGWMPPSVFVLYDGSRDTPQPVAESPAIYLPVTGHNPAPQLNRLMDEQGFDWFLMLDAGATVSVAGLFKAAVKISEGPTTRALFADEIAQPQDDTSEVMLRPDFSLDYLLSCPAVTSKHWMFNRYSVIDAGRFDPHYPQALELDLILRLIEHDGMGGLEHIAEPLVTYRPDARESNPDETRTLQRHLLARGYENGQVIETRPRQYQIKYGHAGRPKVSIIIATRDQILLLQRCVESILEKTTYPNYEILIVDNDSQTPEAVDWLNGVAAMGLEQVRVLRHPGEFDRSALYNSAARQATGEYLLLLDNSTTVLHGDWLDNLLNHAQRPEVGIVGAKLLAPDNTIRHAGLILGLHEPVTPAFRGQSGASEGYMQRLTVDQNYSAVSDACLMISRVLFDAADGLDEGALNNRHRGVDLCLRVKESGRLIVWTPHVVLLHEAAQAEAPDEHAKHALYTKWLKYIAHDPAYNDNFSARAQGLQLETNTALTWRPLSWRPVPIVLSHLNDLCPGSQRLNGALDTLADALLIEHVSVPDVLTLGEFARLRPEALILQCPLSEASLDDIRTIKAHSQALRLCDMDQYPPSAERLSGAPSAQQVRAGLEASLALMDKVVVSSTGLADELSALHPHIDVIETRLSEHWRRVQCHSLPHDKPRIGWVGTQAEVNDLALIADVIKAFADRVEWIIMGPCPQALRPYVHEWRSPVEGVLYPGVLACLDLDLALIPAGDDVFGEYRSCRLALEFGACGYPVIATDVQGLRNNLPLTRVHNTTADWTDAIDQHLNDLDESKRLGQALKQRVMSDWIMDEAYLQRWLQVLLDR